MEIFNQIPTGAHENHSKAIVRQLSQVEISTEQGRGPVLIDGEIYGYTNPIRYGGRRCCATRSTIV